jgi:hypothetical protein
LSRPVVFVTAALAAASASGAPAAGRFAGTGTVPPAAVSPPAPAAPIRTAVAVIRGDVQIGRFRVQRDGTLDGAIRAFGPPTSLERGRYQSCAARWADLGLRINFYNLGGQNPCVRQYGYFSDATMVGRHWQTAKGLRLGDPAHKLYGLYTPRRFTGPWAWLVTRYLPYGGGSYYPGLSAKIQRGWVVAFRIRHPSGGE